jgi:hypothetical protein
MLIATTILTRELAALALTMPLVICGVYLISRTKKIQSWRETKGKILLFREADFPNSRAIVHYSYLAHGVLLEGTHLTICDPILASGGVPVRKLASLFPAGKEVTVYFDENNPKKCVLRKTGYFVPVLIFAFGVVGEFVLAWWIEGGNTLPPDLRPTIIHL